MEGRPPHERWRSGSRSSRELRDRAARTSRGSDENASRMACCFAGSCAWMTNRMIAIAVAPVGCGPSPSSPQREMR